MTEQLFYLGDGSDLREKLARAERDSTMAGRVWSGVRHRARTAPMQFPWFLPFVATVTRAPGDIAAAAATVERYVASLPVRQLSAGLQFHFWCYAFPHARWMLYFHWLRALGAWSRADMESLRDALLTFQFVNFFGGMRSKPEPDCVDNQTLSLCFSNALAGALFTDEDGVDALACRLREEGARRLPALIGGIPPGGYTGEGSTYMDVVVGPAIPFVVELLERIIGGNWFDRDLPPLGGSAAAVARMVAREWIPGGLLLPWDHYGYSIPLRSCMAYAARRTGEPFYRSLLEHQADWAFDTGACWGVDDLVWTLAWWPDDNTARPAERAFLPWAAPETGATLVADDESLYLMQMWDESMPRTPHRAHVNPNALVLSAFGSPLTVDGVPATGCDAFAYNDTWVVSRGLDFREVRSNFGAGCAGAHGVLLVDGWEGMRAMTSYEQSRLVSYDTARGEIIAEASALYREHYPDTRCMLRRSRLCANRFWLIEDLACFDQPHEVTVRWWLRPARKESRHGVLIETAEGVRVWLLPLLESGALEVTRVDGYPAGLDGASLRVDSRQHGTQCRWLWLAWPVASRREVADVADDWQALPDPDRSLVFDEACRRFDGAVRIPMTMPAFLLGDYPVVSRWWYRRRVDAPAGQWWLRLPRGMRALGVWVNGAGVDVTSHRERMALLPPQLEMPCTGGGPVEIVIRLDTGASQDEGEERQGSGFWGRPAVFCPSADGDTPVSAVYGNSVVTINTGDRQWQIPHILMEAV